MNNINELSFDDLMKMYREGQRIDAQINLIPAVYQIPQIQTPVLPQIFTDKEFKSSEVQKVQRISSLSQLMALYNSGNRIEEIKYLNNGEAIVTLSNGKSAFVIIVAFSLIMFLVVAFFYYKAGKWVAKKVDERW